MSEIKISVIMPCYNGAKNIENSIISFVNQSYQNKELIIVDGKSTDTSHAIIDKFCNEYSFIKWVNENDTSVTDALNIGIKYSTGDFIGFLMTDDHYCNNNFFLRCNQLKKYIDFDVLYSNTYYYLTANNKKEIYYWKPENKLNRIAMLEKGSSTAIIDSTLIRKSVFDTHLFDSSYNLCSDYEFFLRIDNGCLLFLYLDVYSTSCLYEGTNLSFLNYDFQVKQFSKVIIKFLLENVSEEDHSIFYKMLETNDKLSHKELVFGQKLLINLIEINNQKLFYPKDYFIDYILKLWVKTNKNYYGNIGFILNTYTSTLSGYRIPSKRTPIGLIKFLLYKTSKIIRNFKTKIIIK